MNLTIYAIECVILCAVFGLLVFGVQLRNPLSFVADYPPEIQKAYYISQNRQKTRKAATKRAIIKKAICLMALLFLFAYMAHTAGAKTFAQGVWASYGYVLSLMLFDTCFLDWVLFAKVKRIRLPGTEHMDQAYRQKWFHVKVLLPMLPIFALCGLAAAWIMERIY